MSAKPNGKAKARDRGIFEILPIERMVPEAASNLASGANPATPLVEPASLDPFDPAKLRLSQDFATSAGVKKHLTTVPVRKPSKEWFVQVHKDDNFRLQTYVIELKEEREMYLVDRSLWDNLSTEATFGPRALFTAISRQDVLFIWPVRLPSSDGKLDTWNESALEAASLATGRWIRVAANMALGAYESTEATANIPAPVWPEMSFQGLLKIAFRGRFIDSMDHIVLRRLRGEA